MYYERRANGEQELTRLISLGNLFAASARGRCICLLELAIVLKLKNNLKKSSGEMQRLQMNPL